jgi:hypothetical protein
VGISLLTATGMRPEALTLCAYYVSRFAKTNSDLQWVVVDDGEPISPITVPPSVKLTVIRPKPRWQTGENTLARNLLAGLEYAHGDWIFFIEDDDWYRADYLDVLMELLLREDRQIIGEVPAIYYNVSTRQYKRLGNHDHASLCQTAIHRDLIPLLVDVCKTPNHEFLDIRLWAKVPRDLQWTFCPASPSSIGIKGLPGRAGIGIGHRPREGWNSDHDMGFLRSKIEEDADLYRDFVGRGNMESEFETFMWKGQLRYRCPCSWENGVRCEFDTYELEAMRLHISQPHVSNGKRPQKPTTTVTSTLVDGNGKPIVYEKPNPKFERASFKKED